MEQEQYEASIDHITIRVTGNRICMVKQSVKTALANSYIVSQKKLEIGKDILQPNTTIDLQGNEVDIGFFKPRIELLESLKNNNHNHIVYTNIVVPKLMEHVQILKASDITTDNTISENEQISDPTTLENSLEYIEIIQEKKDTISENAEDTLVECEQFNNPIFVKKRKLKVKNIILVLLIIIFLFLSIQITQFLLDMYHNKKNHEKLIAEVIEVVPKTETEEEQFKVDFDKLKKINQEILGWVRFNQNKVNYPIVKTKNNTYYLTHAFDKSYNQSGAIFMDYRNTSFDNKNVILFGHAMPNGTMFGSIEDVFKEGFFDKEENHYIKINNQDNEILIYEIFSYYIIEKEEYYITPFFNSDNEFLTFINTIEKRSYYDFDVDVSINDNILTLSTCHGTGNTTKRKVVHAKRIYELPVENNQ